MNVPSRDDPAALLALTRMLFGLQPDQATVTLGRVPEGWPPDLVPPAPVEIVGGMSAGGKLSAVFRYPPDTASAIVEYRTLVENNGWKPAPALGGGFDHTQLVMLCRDSYLATLHQATGGSSNPSILVSVSPCDDWPCRTGARFDHGTIKIPRLVSPPGVESHGGGQCGAGDHTTHNIRITTTLTPTELLPLYASQLAGAGWHMGEIQTTATSALQWAEASDQRGRVWRGMLAIYGNGPACDVFIYMATSELRPSRPDHRSGLPNAR
jgi:hypothetical protein